MLHFVGGNFVTLLTHMYVTLYNNYLLHFFNIKLIRQFKHHADVVQQHENVLRATT